MKKKLSDEDKKAIKEGLDNGFTFDEIMGTLEAMNNDDEYVNISYNSAENRAGLHGKTPNLVKAIIKIISVIVENQDSAENKLVVLQTINNWTSSKAFELKEEYEKSTDCGGPIEIKKGTELEKILRDVFSEKFGEGSQND